jgi:hypothetical protein
MVCAIVLILFDLKAIITNNIAIKSPITDIMLV